jgi:hypothetical protein
MTNDVIQVEHNGHGYQIIIHDYYPFAPLDFWLSDDQAADLRAQLSPKLRHYPKAVSPAKARFTTQ